MPETKSKSKRDTQDKMYSVEEGIVLPKDEYQRIFPLVEDEVISHLMNSSHYKVIVCFKKAQGADA